MANPSPAPAQPTPAQFVTAIMNDSQLTVMEQIFLEQIALGCNQPVDSATIEQAVQRRFPSNKDPSRQLGGIHSRFSQWADDLFPGSALPWTKVGGGEHGVDASYVMDHSAASAVRSRLGHQPCPPPSGGSSAAG